MKALVLSGGGAKGAYQVGALRRWMGEDGHDYDAVCGISVGAINGAFLAQFPKGDPKRAAAELRRLWQRVTNDKVKRSWFPFSILESIWKPSVYDSSPLGSWIRSELSAEKIRASGRKLRVMAVSWNSGEARVIDESAPDLPEWVIASSAFPVMLTPVSIGGELWTDGGLRSVTPLGEAIRLGAEEIHVIMTSDPFAADPFDAGGKAAIPGFALRAIDVLSDQVMRADLEICGLKNDLATAGHPYRCVKLRLLQPSSALSSDALDFDPASIEKMEQLGYDDACRAVEATAASEVRRIVKRPAARKGAA
jgi:NTE family protein